MSNEELVQQIRDGFNVTDSMLELYENNLPMIKKIVAPYSHSEPMEDLLQESYFGLWQAVQKYDANKGVKFMSYAPYWIRQACNRYIQDNGSCVRIPANFQALIRRYRKYVEEFVREHGEKPNLEQIEHDLGFSEKQIEEIRIYMQEPQSIDEPVGVYADGEAYSLSDVLSDGKDLESDIIDQEYNTALRKDIWYAVDNYLSVRQKEIIYLSYKNNLTLDAIGKSLGISKNSVAQLKRVGLRNLRMGKAKRLLMKYAETDRLLYTCTSVQKFENYGSYVEEVAVRRVSIEEYIREDTKRCMLK